MRFTESGPEGFLLDRLLAFDCNKGSLKSLKVWYQPQISYFLNGPTPASFIVNFRSFQTNIITIFTSICEKMSIQYAVPGFEPTTLEPESSPITTGPDTSSNDFVMLELYLPLKEL